MADKVGFYTCPEWGGLVYHHRGEGRWYCDVFGGHNCKFSETTEEAQEAGRLPSPSGHLVIEESLTDVVALTVQGGESRMHVFKRSDTVDDVMNWASLGQTVTLQVPEEMRPYKKKGD